jgi:hypothetical protein
MTHFYIESLFDVSTINLFKLYWERSTLQLILNLFLELEILWLCRCSKRNFWICRLHFHFIFLNSNIEQIIILRQRNCRISNSRVRLIINWRIDRSQYDLN